MAQPDKEPEPLSLIAHKLRTPLTVILSTVNNFIDGAYGKTTGEQKKWLKKLESHTTQLENLTSRLLDIVQTRPEDAETVHKILKQADRNESLPRSRNFPSGRQTARDHSSSTILVVDDEPDILETIQEGFGMKGYKTEIASSAEEAMEKAVAVNPDVILMDVLLQTRNGMEVGRAIKNRLGGFVPVILMTGQNDLRDKISDNLGGSDDLLTKPFYMEELFSRVSAMLKLKSLHDQLEQERRKNDGAV